MDKRIDGLISRLASLEEEFRCLLSEEKSSARKKQAEFNRFISSESSQLKKSFYAWLIAERPQNYITGPVIYGMIFPLLIFDISITLYQLICFPIYRVKKVNRSEYIVFDRHHLSYLDFIERFHCSYCAYASGLIAYASEIVARTEQYFCPIKHAVKITGEHSRYRHFIRYGDVYDLKTRLEALRVALEKMKE